MNLYVIIFLAFFMYYNRDGLIFLGDSGIYILGLLTAINLIYIYNKKYLFVEDVAVLMLLPILDLIRIFLIRVKNNKNPFLGDRLHIHHILLLKYKDLQTVFILNSLYILTLALHFFFDINFLINLFILILFYFYFLKKK